MALFYKRLEAGTYQLTTAPDECGGIEIDATDLAIMLNGIDIQSATLGDRPQPQVDAENTGNRPRNAREAAFRACERAADTAGEQLACNEAYYCVYLHR